MDDTVIVGTIGKPHGIRGELRAYPTGPTLDSLARGARVMLTAPAGERVLTIEALRDAGSHRLIRFREITDRDGAAAVVGATLVVDAVDLADLGDDDEYYVRDLIGCRVIDEDDTPIGTVREVHDGAANPAVEVDLAGGESLLLPFTHDAVANVDLGGRRLIVRRGLLGGGDI